MVVLIGSYLNVDVFGTIFFVFFWLPLKSMLTLLTPITFIQILQVCTCYFQYMMMALIHTRNRSGIGTSLPLCTLNKVRTYNYS